MEHCKVEWFAFNFYSKKLSSKLSSSLLVALHMIGKQGKFLQVLYWKASNAGKISEKSFPGGFKFSVKPLPETLKLYWKIDSIIALFWNFPKYKSKMSELLSEPLGAAVIQIILYFLMCISLINPALVGFSKSLAKLHLLFTFWCCPWLLHNFVIFL